MRPLVAVLIFLLACGGLAAGANLLVKNAASIAEELGISRRVISISMVAVGTSIPEVATSVIAAFKKETDISVGNIIGSNIMNILSVLGITSVIAPIGVENVIARFDIPWMLGASLLLLLLMLPSSRSRIDRWEGIVMIVVYLLYLYLIF
jgi:cation:H+ antiporter